MLPVTAVAVLFVGLGPLPVPCPPSHDADGFPLPPGAVARSGSSRFRAGEDIERLIYSPDGKYLVAGTPSAACVWDAATGRLVLRVGGALRDPVASSSLPEFGYGPVSDLERVVPLGFDAEGALVVCREGDPPRPRLQFSLSDPKQFLRPEPDFYRERAGPVLLQRIELPTGRPRGSVRIPADTHTLTLSPDGRRVAYRLADGGGIGVADVTSGKELWRHEAEALGSATGRFSPDGKQLAWERRGPQLPFTIVAFDAVSGRPRGTLVPEFGGGEWLFSPDGRWLVTNEHGFEVWDTATRTRAFKPEGGVGGHLVGFLSADRLVVGSAQIAPVVFVQVWNLKDRRRTGQWPAVAAHRLAVAPGGRTVACYQYYRPVCLRDRESGQVLPASGDPSFPELDGFALRGTLRLNNPECEWDWRTGRIALRDRAAEDDERPYSWQFAELEGKRPGGGEIVAFSPFDFVLCRIPAPDGHAILPNGHSVYTWKREDTRLGSETEITRWYVTTGKALSSVRAVGRLDGLKFTPDGGRFVARRWGRDPDGQRAGGADRGYLAVFDTRTGRTVSALTGTGGLEQVEYAISPDGRTVAVGRTDGRLVLSEVATGRVRCVFGHAGPIFRVAFSPDGKLLAANSPDAPILVWDVRGGPTGFPTTPPDDAALAAAWENLASEYAHEGFDAIRLFAAFPDRALPVLRTRRAPDGLRAIRAVEAVEWMRLPAAVAVLEAWAGGSERALLAAEARAALGRLRAR